MHQRIDETIAKAHLGKLADTANDYEFLRRLYLNFLGRTPTVDELTEFINNSEPEKRSLAIDHLLGSQEFDSYFTSVLDVMFMERRTGKRVAQAKWLAFLQKVLHEKWSFDRIVQSILTADGTAESRGAAKFLLERNVEPNAITRDVGRIFLGRDLQCAQCHDHPTIVDYEQSEYYGIFAFVNRSYLFEKETKDKNVKKSFVGEKAEGSTEFSSVFSPDDSSSTAPRLLGELTLDAEPRFEGEEAYVVAPSKKSAAIPKFSRRGQLARLITHPANGHFARNVVNRFWKHMMGFGLVDPVDFHHSDNPPSHPALLGLLANEFVEFDYDFRYLLREIALSKIYQQSVDFSADISVVNIDVSRHIDELVSEITTLESDAAHNASPSAIDQLQSRRNQVAEVDQSISETAKQLEEIAAQNEKLKKSQTELQKSLKSKQSQLAVLQEATAAAKKVADSFPDDNSLKEKQAAYQQLADQIVKDIESINAQLTEKESLLTNHGKQLKELEYELIKLRADRIGLADMVAEARGVLQQIYSQQRQHKSLIVEKKQQLSAMRSHQEYLALLENQQLLTNRSIELKSSVDSMANQRETLNQSIADIKVKLSTQNDLVTKLTQESKIATDALTERQGVLDSLKVAIEKAQGAAGEIADSELDAAVATLNEKHNVLNQQLTSDQQLAIKKQEELVKAQALLKQQQTAQVEIDAKMKVIADRDKELADAISARDVAVAESTTAKEILHKSWERRFAVRAIIPLSPEQLAGSTISALELEPRYQLEAEAEWNSKNKDKKPEEIDEAKKKTEIARLLKKRLDQVNATYVSMFAAPGGAPQDVFSATADQALFLANDGQVQSWLSPAEGSLLKRLESIENNAEIASQLHTAILSRPATQEEISEIVAFLSQHSDAKNKAIRELAWGLLTSLEFRFNH